MPDVDKLFEKAEKFLQKQRFESALETYLEIYRYEPNDEAVLQNLGDLSLKLNRTADGLRFQSQLVDHYVKRNDLPKAVATCRKALKFAPQDVGTLTKLAGLLEKSKKNVEALEAYREALEIHRKAGATQQAVDCLQHIVKLDPENLQAHVELAEQATKLHQPKIATPAFLSASQLARKAGQEERWAELAEKAHVLDPTDEAAGIAVGEVFVKKGRAADAIPLLESLVQSRPDDLTVTEHLVQAYLDTRKLEKAEPLVWKLFQARPDMLEMGVKLIERLLQAGNAEKALGLADKVKDHLSKQGKRGDFLKIMERMYEADESNVAVLEKLVALYDEMNKEDGLRRSLSRLFNLYLGGEQYQKAADTLETMIGVDPYGEGHYDRLLNLEGHIDNAWYKNLLSRVQPTSSARGPSETQTAGGPAAPQKTEALENLIIEGEMYSHYPLASKLTETLEKINRLYPGAEERNKRLRDLYDATGFTPAPAPAAASAAPGGVSARAEAEAAPSSAGPSPQSVEDLRKISEITGNIYRESTPQDVMQVAVNALGRALNVSRCWGALGGAGSAPTLMVEYCSPGATPSDVSAVLKVYDLLSRQAATSPDGWLIEDAAHAPVLAAALPEIQKLGIKSLLALPLIDRDEPAGFILVEQCDRPRAWTAGNSLFLKSISTQAVIAVNNTKLRRLVRSLAGSDQETALLPRSAYVDCLLAESSRAKEHLQQLTVCLLEPAIPTSSVKTAGDAAVQKYFDQVSKALLSSLRQNDVAIRYGPWSVALVFPDTGLPQGSLTVEKLRQVVSQVKLNGEAVPGVCAAVCDVQLGANFDVVDGVTEVINRLDAALDEARKEGGKRLLISKFAD